MKKLILCVLVVLPVAGCGADGGSSADNGELPPLSADPMTGNFGGQAFTPASAFMWSSPVAGAPETKEYELELLDAANASCPATYAERTALVRTRALVVVKGIIPDAESRSDDSLEITFDWKESSVSFSRGRIALTAESATEVSGKLVAKPFSGDEYVNGAFTAKVCAQ